MGEIKKPHLGIMPEYIWKKRRRMELQKAIIQYLYEPMKIPEEWIREYNKLIEYEEENKYVPISKYEEEFLRREDHGIHVREE